VSEIRWRLHLASAPEAVWDLLATDHGRSRFWAESSSTDDARVTFHFPSGESTTGAVLEADRPRRFAVEYFGSAARFTLEADGAGGTDLTLAQDVREEWHAEVNAGWVSVLLALKAASDFEVDLRNHDPRRTWSQGYCDN
jgi:uncharacterized protein YndB with AHSA1/START domain